MYIAVLMPTTSDAQGVYCLLLFVNDDRGFETLQGHRCMGSLCLYLSVRLNIFQCPNPLSKESSQCTRSIHRQKLSLKHDRPKALVRKAQKDSICLMIRW
jgi:hypothetical protein